MSNLSRSGVEGNPQEPPKADRPQKYRNLPTALKPLTEEPIWVVWRWTSRSDPKGETKWTKPPFQPKQPDRNAANNDPATWGTYAEALSAAPPDAEGGIGLNLLGSNIAAIDLDKCRDPATGKVAAWAVALINEAGTYVEVTPSGTGLRIIGIGDGAKAHRAKKDKQGAGFEIYRTCERYITITGRRLGRYPDELNDIDALVDRLVAEAGASEKPKPETGAADEGHIHADDDLLTLLTVPYRHVLQTGELGGYASRSEAINAVVRHMRWRGMSRIAILHLLAGSPLADRYKNQAQLEGDVDRILGKAGAVNPASAPIRIQTSGEFIADFAPPHWLIFRVMQQGFLYALTAPASNGKTALALLIAMCGGTGWKLAGIEVEAGRVLYLAGENPDDARARWITMGDEFDFDPMTIPVHFVGGRFDIDAQRGVIEEAAEKLGGFSLIIVDTSATFFKGSDENSNVEALAHAQMLRALTRLPGKPAILVLCHPQKWAEDAFLPRGGSAFLAEIDGNLVCVRDGPRLELHYHIKIRGPDFQPIPFRLREVDSRKLKDTKGRNWPTVIAEPMTDEQGAALEAKTRSDEDAVMVAMLGNPSASFADLASELGWHFHNGTDADRSRVQRTLKRLEKATPKMARTGRGSAWELTEKGREIARQIRGEIDRKTPPKR